MFSQKGWEMEGLKRKYEEALQVDGVVGLVIGTRPDCMPEELLQIFMGKETFPLLQLGSNRLFRPAIVRVESLVIAIRDEISGVFPGIYQYLCRTGRTET